MEDSAAILVIGNEILSGKVRDSNSPFLVEELRALGHPVGRIAVIPDGVETIGRTVAELSRDFCQVFTSGGVGPTLDDLTFEGIARAFELELVENPQLAEIIRNHYGERTTESHMKMAILPSEALLTWSDELPWPHIEIRNVMVLPGDPVILRKKFTAARERFRRSPWHLGRVYTRLEEGDLAPLLDRLHDTHPRVSIGSYPVYKNPEYEVQITLESKDRSTVENALRNFREMLRDEDIVRIDPPSS